MEEGRPARPGHMPTPMVPAQNAAMTIGDIYYVIFRHKWKIFLCTMTGLVAAVGFVFFFPQPFQSDAKLFVRYVVTDTKTPAAPGADMSKYTSPDQRGETIMESEQEILTSLDLAKQVAETVGPDKILAKWGGGKDLDVAAVKIQKNLLVEVPRMSSVIHIVFRHPDPAMVQPVLRAVIDQYLKMHVDIHRAVGIIGDFLTQETDQLRTRLAQTEEELRKARNKAGVISLEDSKKANSDQMARLRQEIFESQAELAERAAVFEQLTKQAPAAAAAATAGAADQPVPPAKQAEYRSVLSRLDLQQKREQELLTQFTEENSRVKDIRAQIADTAAAKKKLEEEFPRLTVTVVATGPAGGAPAANSIDLNAEAARLTALQSKIKVLNAQLDQVKADAANVDQVEASILELRRKKELEEANYRYYAASLEQARINEALGTGKVSNISQIQTPSPPAIDQMKYLKVAGGIFAGGMAVGLVWAFLIEFLLDRTVRRPIDVERILGLPLFLSIPALGSKRALRRAKRSYKETVGFSTPPMETHLVPAIPSGNSALLALPENAQILHTFHETLRDRLISYFESRNLTHKPKLVAVTGLGRGSGVTTTAAGLASSLSETGEGNVLLVDMTIGQGAAQQFYRGKEIVGLEDILQVRDSAQVQDKLFVVAEEPSGDRLSRILPQRFTKIVPKLKASNFDYIIFDMPPVSQISITPRLAGFMDMVLMVIESEKTDQELVRRAAGLLAQSKAHVGAVLNKTNNYVPAPLHQEYIGSL